MYKKGYTESKNTNNNYFFFQLAFILHCDYRNQGHPDDENQSQDRTETIDSNIFKLSQSNVRYKTVKSQLVR